MMSDESKYTRARPGIEAAFEGLKVSQVKPNVLADKTMELALQVIALHESLGARPAGRTIAGQLLRSSTSVGAQYREACRARSRAEFISKLESCLQEADESLYWLELLERSRLSSGTVVQPIRKLCEEIIRLMVSSVRTVKGGRSKS